MSVLAELGVDDFDFTITPAGPRLLVVVPQTPAAKMWMNDRGAVDAYHWACDIAMCDQLVVSMVKDGLRVCNTLAGLH